MTYFTLKAYKVQKNINESHWSQLLRELNFGVISNGDFIGHQDNVN